MNILIIAAFAVSTLGGRAERSIEKLPACRAAAVSAPERWKTVESRGARVRFQVAPDMTEVPDPKMACIHGCKEWARGTFRVLVVHGAWGAGSFEDETWATACAEKHGALRVVLMRSQEDGKHAVVVWPVNDSSTRSTEDFLLNVQWSDPADAADAETVIASVR